LLASSPQLSAITSMNTSLHPYRIHSRAAASSSSSSASSSLPSSPAAASFSHLVSHAPVDPRNRSFSVMQYNVLAGNLGTPEHFPYTKPHLLDWSFRRQQILSKVRHMLAPAAPSSPSYLLVLPGADGLLDVLRG
jgi:hypothetical protein